MRGTRARVGRLSAPAPARESGTAWVYRDPRWRSLRARWLAAHPACARCGARGPRLHVDHVVPVRLAPRRAFDATNLQTLCPSCHRRKDASLQTGRGYADEAGADGFPADPRHPWYTPC